MPYGKLVLTEMQGRGSSSYGLFPDNMALADRHLSEFARRHTGSAVKAADEIRQVAEPAFVGDLADGPGVISQHAGRPAQPGTHQVLMRRYPENLSKQPQEVKWAQVRLLCRL